MNEYNSATQEPPVPTILENQKKWDSYFYNICEVVAQKSPCLSRKIGAVLVYDNLIVSTGYNGPPRGIPHCGHDRFMKDKALTNGIENFLASSVKSTAAMVTTRFYSECPRRVLGYESGEGMQWCPAQHAEENAISNAAFLGVSIEGATLYMNSVTPCQKCFGTLINVGIIEVVVKDTTHYDKHSQFLIENSDIEIREFNL